MTAQPSSEEALRDFAEWLRSSLALAEGFSLGSLLTGGTLDSLQRAELAALLEERFSSSAGDLLLQSSLTVRQLYGLFAVKREFGGSGMVGHAAVAALASRIRRW